MPRLWQVAFPEKVMPTSVVLYSGYSALAAMPSTSTLAIHAMRASLSPSHIWRGTTNVKNLEQIGQHQKQQQQQQQQQAKQLGNDFLLRPLVPSDAPFVDSWWRYRSSKSIKMINRQIEADNQNGTVCCCLRSH
jgi:hypothetical protein